jgi:hypothetical protein
MKHEDMKHELHVFMLYVFTSVRFHMHKLRLLVTQRQTISSQAEFNRVAQGRATQHLDLSPVAKAHFQQPAAKVDVAANRDDTGAATNAQVVQRTSHCRTSVITARYFAGFIHLAHPSSDYIDR